MGRRPAALAARGQAGLGTHAVSERSCADSAWRASDREIAAHLGITPARAQKHVQGLLGRLGVPNRMAAVAALMS